MLFFLIENVDTDIDLTIVKRKANPLNSVQM